MKRIILISSIFFLLSCTGCVAKQNVPEYRSNKAEVVYKNSGGSNIGDISAVYGGRIYFYSQECGERGIYSMKLDGEDLRMETECRDIQKLQIHGDQLFYLGLDNVCYGDERSRAQWGNKFYSLYKLDLATKEKTELSEIEEKLCSLSYDKVNNEDQYRGIWDFYYLGDDVFLTATLDTQIPTQRFILQMSIFEEERILEWVKDSNYFEIYKEGIELPEVKCVLFKKDNVYLVSDYGPIFEGNQINVNYVSLYDTEIHTTTITEDSILSQYRMPVIFEVKDDIIFGAVNHVLFEYDCAKKELVRTCSFAEAESIKSFESGQRLLVSYDGYEAIYIFDRNSFQAEEKTVFEKGRVIDIGLRDYLYIDQESVSKRLIENNQEIWETRLQENYLTDEHKIEVGGNWLFIKYFDYETEQSELKERIWLKDGSRDLVRE